MNPLSNDYVDIILFAICIFTVTFIKIDSLINYFYTKTEGTRKEVIELMEKMLIDVDHKKITITLLLMSIGLGFVFFLLFWPNIILGLIAGFIVTLIGWKIPKVVMQMMWNKYCNTLVAQMVDGMTIMANGVKSGLSVPQSIERITENLNGPIVQEFKLILNKLRLGMSIEEALTEFSERIPMPDVLMFVSSINILMEVGGNLAETFETITYTIRERQKIQRKIEALTQASITQGIIITLVPFILLIAFSFMDPEFVKPLFTTVPGWIMLFIMIFLQSIGGFLMKKIVTIDV